MVPLLAHQRPGIFRLSPSPNRPFSSTFYCVCKFANTVVPAVPKLNQASPMIDCRNTTEADISHDEHSLGRRRLKGTRLGKFAAFFRERKFALAGIDRASPPVDYEMTKSLGFFPRVQICTHGSRLRPYADLGCGTTERACYVEKRRNPSKISRSCKFALTGKARPRPHEFAPFCGFCKFAKAVNAADGTGLTSPQIKDTGQASRPLNCNAMVDQ
jgi:hypothetical protein